jgi:hypothetical protein
MPGWKTWAALEEVTAANMNSFVRDQTVQVFTNASARSAAITAPTRGLVSLLTDTGSYEMYYGATTGWARPWGTPWGYVAVAQTTAGTTPVSTIETVCLNTPAFSATTNRLYKATFSATTVTTNNGDLHQARLRKDNTSGTDYGVNRFAAVGTYLQSGIAFSFYFTGVTGTQTVCATLQRINGSGTVGLISGLMAALIVEDIGPANGTAPVA